MNIIKNNNDKFDNNNNYHKYNHNTNIDNNHYDDDNSIISLNDLKKKINLNLNNPTLSEYLIYELKIKFSKNKYEISINLLKNINSNTLKDIIFKIYNIYLKELHYKKYEKLLTTYDKDINFIYTKLNFIFNNL